MSVSISGIILYCFTFSLLPFAVYSQCFISEVPDLDLLKNSMSMNVECIEIGCSVFYSCSLGYSGSPASTCTWSPHNESCQWSTINGSCTGMPLNLSQLESGSFSSGDLPKLSHSLTI